MAVSAVSGYAEEAIEEVLRHMKNKRFLTVITAILMSLMIFTACGSSDPSSLEEYLSQNSDAQKEFETAVAAAEEQGMTVEVTGNEIIFTFDLNTVDGMTEELAKSDEFKTAFDSAMESQGDNFKELASSMAEMTGIDGISVVVNYAYDGEIVSSGTFTQDGSE